MVAWLRAAPPDRSVWELVFAGDKDSLPVGVVIVRGVFHLWRTDYNRFFRHQINE